MPEYNYRCCECKQVTSLFLPISTDPKEIQVCECGWAMKRIITGTFSFKGFKTFAGDWFKKAYGHDMADPYMDKVRQKEDYETMARELEKNK